MFAGGLLAGSSLGGVGGVVLGGIVVGNSDGLGDIFSGGVGAAGCISFLLHETMTCVLRQSIGRM